MNWFKSIFHKRKSLGKWPFRLVRPVVRIELTDGLRRKPREMALLLRQFGYTNGDKIVVLQESDFKRLAKIAHERITNPMMVVAVNVLEREFLSRMENSIDMNRS